MAHHSLSDAAVKRLPAMAEAEGVPLPAYYWDPGYPGLGARVNRDGSVSWIMKVRIGAKTHWKTLGSWPDMKTRDAKEEVDSLKTRIRSGEDLNRSRLQPVLWADLVDRFEREHLPSLKPKTQENYRSILRLHIRPAFKEKLANEVDEGDVRTFHQTLGKTGKLRQANVCLRLIGMIFDRSEAWRNRPLNSSPVLMLRRGGYRAFREETRDRPLDDAELARLGEALVVMEAQGYGQFCDFVRVLYFSGARRGEVLGLAWDWIDEDRKVIRWPDSKTGTTSKPLNDALFEVLAHVPRFKDITWVFPSSDSASGHLEDVKRPWKRLLELAEIKDLHRHDLRHNLGNVAADEGENLQTVAALLGHRQTSTTERYSKTRGLAASNRLGVTLKRKLGGSR